MSVRAVFWAGGSSLAVTVKGENGGLLSSVPVKLIIADDQKISKTVVSENEIARFSNVPPITIILAASGPGNTFGMLATTGDTASQTLVMKGFDPPSEIDNNDFSQGLQGWEAGNAPLGLIPHNEGGGGTPGPGKRKAPPTWDAKEKREESSAGPDLSDAFGGEGERTSSNMDLRLATSGVGTQSVSRTFRVSPGVTAIKVRYRFVTTEVISGYMGSQFNDSYSIAVREQGSSRARLASGSLNGLGPDAFDANGRTAWYTVELPVVNSKSGEAVVQVEAAVTNVADGQYDSALDLDYVKEEYLSIRVNLTRDGACPNEAITFSIDGDASGTVTWAGGGEPATGTGPEFTTRFENAAEINVQARQDNGGVIRTGNKVVPMWEASGADWVARFPPSVAVEDLASPFREGVENFIRAMRQGNATVNIAATLRPPQRAYLMHYAYRIANEGLDPSSIEEYEGVNICWVHRDADGNIDIPASREAARAMNNGYRIRYLPSRTSRHIDGLAIDMNIEWTGGLTIQTADGGEQTINTLPRTGARNTALHGVGAGYGVIKLLPDPPHWSNDGR